MGRSRKKPKRLTRPAFAYWLPKKRERGRHDRHMRAVECHSRLIEVYRTIQWDRDDLRAKYDSTSASQDQK